MLAFSLRVFGRGFAEHLYRMSQSEPHCIPCRRAGAREPGLADPIAIRLSGYGHKHLERLGTHSDVTPTSET